MRQCHLDAIKVDDVFTVAEEVSLAYAETKTLYLDVICCNEPGLPVPASARQQFASQLEQRLITTSKVDAMASAITDVIAQMNMAALDVLPAAPDRTARKLFRPRAMNRKYQHLRRERSS